MRPKRQISRFDPALIRYGFTIFVLAVAFLLRLVLVKWVGPEIPPFILLYPGVMFIAIVFGLWPGLLATAIGAVSSAYWILPPEGLAVDLSHLVALCVFSAMGVLISVVAEFYRRRGVELAKANETLRDLSAKVLSAHEDERKRIAGELHDTVGSSLSGIKFKIENLGQQIGNNPEAATESLNTIIPVIQEAIEECRRMQMDLRPSMLDDLGLLATLSWFCKRFQTIYPAIQIGQQIDITENEIPDALKIVIYRVLQEAMNNVAKHSKADLVRLSLRTINGRMVLGVEDNGQGFVLEKALALASTRRGLGLTSMRERTELSGGSFAVESVEGKGTTIRASWPC